MKRVVEAEALDHLATDDPQAIRSRIDLQRIHRFMGTRQRLRRALQQHAGKLPVGRPVRMLELGAGDGSLMLAVARSCGTSYSAVELTLLDRQALVTDKTASAYAALGWQTRQLQMDALDWAGDTPGSHHADESGWDIIVTSLFLHHFESPQLAALLATVAASSRYFAAYEPRRAGLALAGSRLVGLIGANAVTRQDAVLSVHAGFTGKELGAAWPQPLGRWTLQETPAGLFGHFFEAARPAGSRHADD